jgi:hypothetical protein
MPLIPGAVPTFNACFHFKFKCKLHIWSRGVKRVMKSTLAKLKNLKFKGKTRLPWAEQRINEYAEYLEEELPDLARQLEKMPFVKFQ